MYAKIWDKLIDFYGDTQDHPYGEHVYVQISRDGKNKREKAGGVSVHLKYISK